MPVRLMIMIMMLIRGERLIHTMMKMKMMTNTAEDADDDLDDGNNDADDDDDVARRVLKIMLKMLTILLMTLTMILMMLTLMFLYSGEENHSSVNGHGVFTW